MKTQYDCFIKQLLVLQQKVYALTEQLHTLNFLRINDYVVVTCVNSNETIIRSGYVRQILPDALCIDLGDGTTEMINRFISLRVCPAPVDLDCGGSTISEWSSIEP